MKASTLCAGLLLCALSAQVAQSTVVIRYVKLDGVEEEQTECLRGNPRGDIWGPPIPGSNKLHCGSFGNTEVAPTRLRVKQSDTLEIQLHMGKNHGGGELEFDVTYGSNPNMRQNPGWKLGKTQTISADTSSEPVNLPLKDLEFQNKATLQVGFTPKNQADPDNKVTHYQCIDIEVTEGKQRSIPPEGYGDPERREEVAPEVTTGGTKTILPSTGLEDIHYILFAVIAVLLVCFIVVWIKYKSPSEEPQQMQFAPQIAMTEKVQAPTEPVEQKSAPPPQKESSTSGSDQEPAPKAEAPPKESAEQIQGKAQENDPDDGSKGRHFHFRYVED